MSGGPELCNFGGLCLPCRVELESMRDRLQHEEVGRAGLIQELDALRERHRSEVAAREHAHKLAK